jgi:aspartate/methionine/tyrosine aminotransferase
MFSSRLPTSLEENRISRAFAAARASGRALVDLTESNPTRVSLRYPIEAILDGLSAPGVLVYRPDPRGLAEARAAIAEHYAFVGRRVDPERLLLTASTSEAYGWLFKLLCDPGDDVLVPQPSYPLFDHLAALEGVTLRPYPLHYQDGWFVDAESLRRALGPRTRAVLVVNPNNPTGSFLKRNEAAAIEALCAERGLALIADEVFAEYAFEPDPDRVESLIGERAALTFSLGGLSKLVGLPQMKLGWIHVAGPEKLRSEAESRLELIADTYLSVGAPVQEALPKLLALHDDVGAQIRSRTARNLARLAQAVRSTSLALLRTEGGWSAIVRVPATRSEEEWVLALLDAGVWVHPGFFFDLEPAHLVVSLLLPEAEFADAIARLVETVERAA